MSTHVLKNPAIWQNFQQQVEKRSWKCNLPFDILTQNFEDVALYKGDTTLNMRRLGISEYVKNDSQWITTILGASRDIVNGEVGMYSTQLKKLHILDALDDFIEHLNCFYTVAAEMQSKGQKVKPLSQHSSQIHDIDKLDPIMLVGYSERFEDGQVTSVWKECVNRHIHINPHHQAHYLWQNNFCNKSCKKCQEVQDKALLEMICDKVSRRLQKNLHGVLSEDMWNVDEIYFQGLPKTWLNKALAILKCMKS